MGLFSKKKEEIAATDVGPMPAAVLAPPPAAAPEKLEVHEIIPIDEALRLVQSRAGLPPKAPPRIKPGLVCKACGLLLANRQGTPADGGEPSECCKTASVLVDLNTIVVNKDGYVIAATHLE